MTQFLTSLARTLLWYAPAAALLLASRRVVMYYQLSSYQFRGFIAALKRQAKHAWVPGAALGVWGFFVCFIADKLSRAGGARGVLAPLLGAALLLLGGVLVDKFSYQQREGKSKLNITTRVKRFYAVFFALMLLLLWLLKRFAPIMGLNALLVAPMPLWVLLAALLAVPIERFVYELYFRDARKMLLGREDVRRIALTGSYGKTSVKFYLQTLLSQKYNVLCTRGSMNTPMGVSTVIRNDLTPAHNVFIAEMGARHRRDIKELCRLVKPEIGILTSVGPQHLETFGSIENIKQTKYDLIRALPDNGFAVFGDDHAIVRTLYQQTDLDKALTGSEDSDIWAEDVENHIAEDHVYTTFTLCFRDGKRLPCTTYVTGAHVIRNILMAVAVARHMGLSDKQIQYGVELIPPIRNRFMVETGPDGVHRINNGYNSNPISSAQTLAELGSGKYEGRHIIITPGFVELGREEQRYNRELGQHIAKVADKALLIGTKRTQPIREGLLESGFEEGDIHVFDTLKDANAFYDTIKQQGDYVLYENDLPDHYSEV